jgi:hypothetical protein
LGTVTDAVTHTPIPAAAIFLSSGTAESTFDTTSDAAGRFQFTGLPSGNYQAAVMKTGFNPRGAPVPVRLTAGDDPLELNLVLIPKSRIRGRVLDADRHPVAQTTVALLTRWRDGKTLEVSDSEGRFEFTDVKPGEYVLNAHPARGGDSMEATQTAPTWFPSATAQLDAASIIVTTGADLSGYDIVLRSVPVVRLSGKVTDERGEPAPGAAVSLRFDTSETLKMASAEDGSFEFWNARRGVARLTAELHRGDTILRAFSSVLIANHDVENLPLRLDLPFALSGTVELGDPRASIQGEAIVVPVDRTDVRISASLDRGGFQLKNLYPGRYWVNVQGDSSGTYLDSVKLGERDITTLGEEVDLMEGGPSLRVIFKRGGGLVRGTIEHGDGAEVVLVPQNGRPAVWPSSCCEGGRFEFGSVPPGDYFAVPYHPSDIEWLWDPAVSRNLIAHAASVHVESGGTAWMELKITAVR